MTPAHLTLAAVAALAAAGKLKKRGSRSEDSYEVGSDLFRESGVNATESDTIIEYRDAMRGYGGWGDFPPVSGGSDYVDEGDVEEYEEAWKGGYEHELAWSRPISAADIGREYVHLEDGHHRAYAASMLGFPIKVKIWAEVK